MKLTVKQERFAQLVFEGYSQHEAYIKAGYSAKSPPAVIDVRASELASNSKVAVRIAALRKRAEDASVMSVLERKQRLSEIARAKLTDFMMLGEDGSWVNLGPETPNGGAIQEIASRTEYDAEGNHPTIHTKVKLHDPVKAIQELNKMEGVYSDGTIINNDNRTVNINGTKERLISVINRIAARAGEIETAGDAD